MTVPIRTAGLKPDLPSLRPERPGESAAVDNLINRAFGPGRFAKTAERLREGRHFVPELSFVAWSGDSLAGCVRLWRIAVGGRPVIFLGPIAVDPVWRKRGLGAALVERACETAWTAGHDRMLLVGDAPFFEPLGFEAVAPGRVVMPGPVDPRRLLARGPRPGDAHDLAGPVLPA